MKKHSLILIAVFLLLCVSSFQYIGAQEKPKEDKLREQEDKSKMQEEINQQKKDMIEQSKHDLQKALLDESRQQIDEEMQNLRDQIREYHDEKGQQREAGRRPDAPFAFSFPGFSFSGVFPNDDAERSSLNFSRSLKETTFSRDYIFDVAPTSKTVSMSINGFCKSGEIRIKIKMPNGKTYSDVVIDESGNLNWKKSFNISEEENTDKTGDWKYEIDAKNATGYFRLSLQTY
jgi:hypothetical protein